VTPPQSIKAALSLFTVFEKISEVQPIGVSELARLTGLDKSRVQRILLTLSEADWIVPAAGKTRRWQVGSKPVSIVRRAGRLQLLERALVEMAALRDEFDETVFLAAPQQGRMVVLDSASTSTPLRIQFNAGDSFAAHSASAVAILAALPRDEPNGLLAPTTDADITRRTALARKTGVAELNSGEFISLAAAIVDEFGSPFATLTLAGPAQRMSAIRRKTIAMALLAAARRAAGDHRVVL